MVEKKKIIRRKPGQVFQVLLSDGSFCYGQTTNAHCVFFNYRDMGEEKDIYKIVKHPILFRIGVGNYVINEGLWPILGVLPVDPEFQKFRDLFTYDSSIKSYILWTMIDGKLEQIKTTPDRIYNLECFASWDKEHVEQRLLDYFYERPNYDVELFRNQHKGDDFPDIFTFYKKYGYDFKLSSDH